MKYLKYSFREFHYFENHNTHHNIDNDVNDILLPLTDIGMEYHYSFSDDKEISIWIQMPYLNNYNGLIPYFFITDIEDVINQLILNIENYGMKLKRCRYLTRDNRHQWENSYMWVTLYNSSVVNRWGVKMPKDDIFSNIEDVDFSKEKIDKFDISFK